MRILKYHNPIAKVNKTCLHVLILLVALSGLPAIVYCQAPQFLPDNQPEQDACGAIQICADSFVTTNSYHGRGLVQESGENLPFPASFYSHWLKVKIATSGNLIFKITPKLWSDNYNFLVFKQTQDSCPALQSAIAI